MKRKCSMCGEIKEETTNYRFMKKQNRYYCYCKDCNKIYIRGYMQKYRANKKVGE